MFTFPRLPSWVTRATSNWALIPLGLTMTAGIQLVRQRPDRRLSILVQAAQILAFSGRYCLWYFCVGGFTTILLGPHHPLLLLGVGVTVLADGPALYRSTELAINFVPALVIVALLLPSAAPVSAETAPESTESALAS